MSDERLREAERRWTLSSSVEDEARYLLERVWVGDLTTEQLELAAHCGSPPAAIACQRAAVSSDEAAWYSGLARWGHRPSVKLATLAAERAASVSRATNDDPRPDQALAIANAWLVAPSDELEQRAVDATWDCHGLDWVREAVMGIRSPTIAHEAARYAVQFGAVVLGVQASALLDDLRPDLTTWVLRSHAPSSRSAE